VQVAALRVVAALGDHLTFHLADVERLRSLRVLPHILQALDGQRRLPPEAVLEGVRVLVRLVVRSTRLSLALLEDLDAYGGAMPHGVPRLAVSTHPNAPLPSAVC